MVDMLNQYRSAKDIYQDDLHDPRWFDLREQVFRYCGKTCKECRSTSHLQVHHKSYDNGGPRAWDYPIGNFEVLCFSCHAGVHGLPTQRECSNVACSRKISAMWKYCFTCHKNIDQALKGEIEALEQQLRQERENSHKLKKQTLKLEESVKSVKTENGTSASNYQEQERLLLQVLRAQGNSIEKQRACIRSFELKLKKRDRVIRELQEQASSLGSKDVSFSQLKEQLQSMKAQNKLLGASIKEL
jgi:hypothetical protein